MGRVRLERALIGALALEHATIGVSRHRYAGLAIASEEDDEEPERPKERVVVTKRARCQARQHHEDAAIAHPDVDPAHAHVGGAIDLSAIRRRKSTPRPHREAKAAHEAGELRTAAVVVATGVGQAQVHLIQAVHLQGALTPALSAVRPPLGDRDGPSAWIAGTRARRRRRQAAGGGAEGEHGDRQIPDSHNDRCQPRRRRSPEALDAGTSRAQSVLRYR
jgi:hypothetical protein